MDSIRLLSAVDDCIRPLKKYSQMTGDDSLLRKFMNCPVWQITDEFCKKTEEKMLKGYRKFFQDQTGDDPYDYLHAWADNVYDVIVQTGTGHNVSGFITDKFKNNSPYREFNSAARLLIPVEEYERLKLKPIDEAAILGTSSNINISSIPRRSSWGN